MEKKKLPFSTAPEDDRHLPDMHLGLYDDVIVFDHVEKVLLCPHHIYGCSAVKTSFTIENYPLGARIMAV